jgi:hypothetical protein
MNGRGMRRICRIIEGRIIEGRIMAREKKGQEQPMKR